MEVTPGSTVVYLATTYRKKTHERIQVKRSAEVAGVRDGGVLVNTANGLAFIADSQIISPRKEPRVELRSIAIKDIESNKHQPRTELRHIKELAASIAEVGVTQPVIVVDNTFGIQGSKAVPYRVVDGHRRIAAAKEAGVDPILALIVDSDTEALEVMRLYASNTQRDAFCAVEAANVVQTLLDLGVKPTAITKATGVKKADIDHAKIVAGAKDAKIPAQATLEEAAALVEFEGDRDRVDQLERNLGSGQFKHTVERLRQERDRTAKRIAVIAEHKAAGVKIAKFDYYGDNGWVGIHNIDSKLTDKKHATCPGHAVVVNYDGGASYYCSDPKTHHGYTSNRAGTVVDKVFEKAKRARRAGWKAATVVRREFAKQLASSAMFSHGTARDNAIVFLGAYASKHGLPSATAYSHKETIAELMPANAGPIQTMLALASAQQEKALTDEVKFNGGMWADNDYTDCAHVMGWKPYFDFLTANGYELADAEKETLQEASARYDKKHLVGVAAVAEEAAEFADVPEVVCTGQCGADAIAGCAETSTPDESCQWLAAERVELKRAARKGATEGDAFDSSTLKVCHGCPYNTASKAGAHAICTADGAHMPPGCPRHKSEALAPSAEDLDTFEIRTCRVCGCTDMEACEFDDDTNCTWVEDDLCSACIDKCNCDTVKARSEDFNPNECAECSTVCTYYRKPADMVEEDDSGDPEEVD